MTTKEMADIIVDALVGAKLVDANNFEQAAEIAEEEIRVRLSLDDNITLDKEKTPNEQT